MINLELFKMINVELFQCDQVVSVFKMIIVDGVSK